MEKIWLKSASEADMIDKLSFARGQNDDGDDIWLTGAHDYALDIIGTVATPGTYAEDETELTPPVVLNGFHANIRCNSDIADLIPADIQIPKPKNPMRDWF